MGTSYKIIVRIPDELDVTQQTLQDSVDSELRRVNDQMSTYLSTSEISRFNDSDSTDWFEVSQETAQVVSYSLEVSAASDGLFDVTVGPLVNAWSFGPPPRSLKPPLKSEIDELLLRIGYRHLSCRLDPPAIRKDIPKVRIDLSAIAKGHGVDRVVEMLLKTRIHDCLVEIGGEVRGVGQRPGGGPWRIGVERPDAVNVGGIEQVVPLNNKSLATSGDYRNFFIDEETKRSYSHTIDPRTGMPVQHDLASVSVMADNCMEADAWATAINVMGAEVGLAAAGSRQMDILLIRRDNQELKLIGTGLLVPKDLK